MDSSGHSGITHLPVSYSPSGRQDLAVYDPYSNPHTPEDEIDLRELWNTILKYRWTIVTFLGVVLATTAIATALMRPVFRATAVVEVKPESGIIKFEGLERTPWREEGRHLATQANILQSKAVAEMVIEKLELDNHPEVGGEQSQRGFINGIKQLLQVFSGEDAGAQGEGGIDGKIKPVRYITSHLEISPIKRSNLLEVSFESFDAGLAAAVANAVVDAYARLNQQRKFKSTLGAKAFLEQEIERVQAKLETSEKQLTEFARKHKIVDVEDKDDVMTAHLGQLNASLAKVEDERIGAQAAYEQAKEGNIEALPAVAEEKLIAQLKNEYASVRGEYLKMSRIYKDAYPGLQQTKAQMDGAKEMLDSEVRRLVLGLRIKYEELLKQEQLLKVAVEKQKTAMLNLKDRAIQYHILKREWESNKELYGGLLGRMKEVGVAAGMELNNVSLVDKAEVPLKPYKPNFMKNMAIALLLGLAGGTGLAFLLAYLDNTVRTPEDVEKLLRLASLSMIPKLDSKTMEVANVDLLSHEQRDSEISEAFRSLRTSLMFSSPEGVPKTLLITSATAGEGKSMSATNLAVVLAQNGASVLLVDADLRKPRVHKVFGFPSTPGLTEHLVGDHQEAVYPTDIPNLSVMPSGTIPPNPAELLSSKNMDTFLKAMGEMFDVVILDSAPILGLADSIIASTKVKGVMLVIASGVTSKDSLREAVKRMRNVRAPIFGAVLNKIDVESHEYSYYGKYYYSYKPDENKEKQKKGLISGMRRRARA